jgi:hypothetical protein
METTWEQAYSLYKHYKTTTKQYKEFAAEHGYKTTELNTIFSGWLAKEKNESKK